eukprot:CAMPEP_0197442190 /NCGR_PEP_ID=MMETSP1175-20131217/8262_1 /TAXON_ID=1003142 /ORGANISM="Triceratium dubium, Strain CCMP147" /LENGTH=488 /DNA_ID=CAMNT_0042972615 /DNA_START=295 /DNA_END=1758 /DNA_ORIENTATION=+
MKFLLAVTASASLLCGRQQGVVGTQDALTATSQPNSDNHRRHLLDLFPASASPPATVARGLTPQFIVLSITGGVTPLAYDLYRGIASVVHQDGCPVGSTWYVSIAQSDESDPYTLCNLITGLRKAKNEIATNTYGPTADPTVEEILGAPSWLNLSCNVPLEEMVGFRTPKLGFSQNTFDRLQELGFLYDSSIADNEAGSAGGSSALWPYTMDLGIAQDCFSSSGSCNQTKSNPGLWEIPLWRMFDDSGNPLTPFDPLSADEDTYDTLQRNFEARYLAPGNKAPLGINIHAAWLVDNGEDFKDWAQDILDEHDDVFFVTTSELIKWMRAPVPSTSYARDCSGAVTDCFPPPLAEAGCGNGDYNSTLCQCVCKYPYTGYNCLESPEWWSQPPTDHPTASPSDFPSESPTDYPTVSQRPSASPTKYPTSAPSFTYAPSTLPPTAEPTIPPTPRPTVPPISFGDFAGTRGSSGHRMSAIGALAAAAAALGHW